MSIRFGLVYVFVWVSCRLFCQRFFFFVEGGLFRPTIFLASAKAVWKEKKKKSIPVCSVFFGLHMSCVNIAATSHLHKCRTEKNNTTWTNCGQAGLTLCRGLFGYQVVQQVFWRAVAKMRSWLTTNSNYMQLSSACLENYSGHIWAYLHH